MEIFRYKSISKDKWAVFNAGGSKDVRIGTVSMMGRKPITAARGHRLTAIEYESMESWLLLQIYESLYGYPHIWAQMRKAFGIS